MDGNHAAHCAIDTDCAIDSTACAGITIDVLDCILSVCKLAELPADMLEQGLCFVARTSDELSVVCETAIVPTETLAREDGWRALKVRGPLDFALTGIMAKISSALADARVAIFAVSTFDTDYVLVQEDKLDTAIAALRAAGCEI